MVPKSVFLRHFWAQTRALAALWADEAVQKVPILGTFWIKIPKIDDFYKIVDFVRKSSKKARFFTLFWRTCSSEPPSYVPFAAVRGVRF